MTKIFVHALEGEPEKPDFTGKTERDIRVNWLVTAKTGGPGPWKVKARYGHGIVLEHSGSGVPPKYIQEIYLPYIANGDDLKDRLLREQNDPLHVDFAPSLTDPDTFKPLEQDSRVTVQNKPGLSTYYLGFYMDRDPFKGNQLLRQAIACAVDVQKHVSLGKGAAIPAVGPIPPNMQGHDPTIHQPPYDQNAAKKLLGKSGYDTTKPLTLVHNGAHVYARNLAEAVMTDLRNLGLVISPRACKDWKEMIAEVQKNPADRVSHMFLYSWHQREPHPDKPGVPGDPYDFLEALFHPKWHGSKNLTRYENSEVKKKLDLRADHPSIQNMVLDDAPMVCLSHWNRKYAYNTRVRQYDAQGNPKPAFDVGDGVLPTKQLTDVDIPDGAVVPY
jgi:ABC-type transport system substrate-binding protein